MKQFKFFKGQSTGPLYWRTAMGEYKLVSDMSNEHIYNLIMMLPGDQIPNPYLGKTHKQWKNIFKAELRYRLNGRV
jgi:hypothetical protein